MQSKKRNGMNMVTRSQLRKYVTSLLSDENGISEESYDLTREISVVYPGWIDDILARVEATEGRFYLPEEC